MAPEPRAILGEAFCASRRKRRPAVYLASHWVPPLAYAGLIFWQSGGPSPVALPAVWSADKLVHFWGYALLGALIWRALASLEAAVRRPVLVVAASAAAAALYGVSDEIHQGLVAQRTAEWGDVLADAAGSLAGALLARRACRRFLRSGSGREAEPAAGGGANR